MASDLACGMWQEGPEDQKVRKLESQEMQGLTTSILAQILV